MVDRDAELAALAAHRYRVVLALTAAMLVIYFGFVLLWAFAKDTLAEQVIGEISVGIIPTCAGRTAMTTPSIA